MTGCVCKQAGWCERHQCLKTEHWVHLCQTHEGYWQKWEEGRGPGQNTKGQSVIFQKGGPGTELKKLLARYWIVDRQGCHCKEHAAIMDAWGPERCRLRIDTILSWMKEEAKERKLPFVQIVAKRTLMKAIRNSESAIRKAELEKTS